MKPNPYLVSQAIMALHAERSLSGLVGDQVSDVVAAHEAGVIGIGYANKPGKADKLAQAQADVIVTTMTQLLA